MQVVMRPIKRGLSQGKEAVIDEILSPKCRSDVKGMSGEGRQGLRGLPGSVCTASPDARSEVQHLREQGTSSFAADRLGSDHRV